MGKNVKKIALLGIAFAIANAQFGHEPVEELFKRIDPNMKMPEAVPTKCGVSVQDYERAKERGYADALCGNQEAGISTNECRWLNFSRVDIGCSFANSDMEFMYSVAGLAQITGQFNPKTGKVYRESITIRTDVAEAKAKECCIKNPKKNNDYDKNCKDGVMDRFSQQLEVHRQYVVDMDIYNSICVKELGSDGYEGADDPRYQRFRK